MVNPYARQLTFLDERTRARRDVPKYLTLIRTLTLLHQHQRAVKTVQHQGNTVEYVEVTLEDIAIANRLASAVLGRSLNEAARLEVTAKGRALPRGNSRHFGITPRASDSPRCSLIHEKRSVDVFRECIDVTRRNVVRAKVVLPAVDDPRHAPRFLPGLGACQTELLAHREGVLDGGVRLLHPDSHLLVAERLTRRQHIKGGRQLKLQSFINEQHVVLFVVVGVVDENVEDHAPEEFGHLP